MSRVGNHGSNARKQRAQSTEEQRGCSPIRHVGRLDTASDWQAQGVYEDVTFASLDVLVRIEATNSSALRCFHGLSVHDHHRWTSRATGFPSNLLVHCLLDACPRARVPPSTEVVIDGAPGRELARKESPLAASAQQIKDRVQDGTKLGCAWPSTGQRCRQERCKQRPRCIAQVRRIASCFWQSPVSDPNDPVHFSNTLLEPGEDFWRLDLATGRTRLLGRLGNGISTSFDLTPDGRQIVFDRTRENSEIVLIDLPN